MPLETDMWDGGEILTILDRARIEDLGINEKMDSEMGIFSCFRYKDEYLIVFHLPNMNQKLSFKTPAQIFNYIEEHS